MEYRKLGNSGLKVSEIGLGTNTFGPRCDEKTSIAIVNQAVEAGINYIDTSNTYGRGDSEEFIGKAIKGQRSRVVIGTKFANPMGDGPNDRGGSRYHIMNALEASLKRLKTDYIDLYQMHVPDPTTPIEETLRTLDDLVRSGRVRYIGCSNFAAWQLCQALWTSKMNSLQSFITVQPRYHFLDREIEKELVPCCQAYNIGVIPWGPLAGGFLTGKYLRQEEPPPGARLSRTTSLYGPLFTEENWNTVAKLEGFAKERGHTVGELAIAWLLAKPWISTVIAGAREIEQVSANVAAGEWKLSAEEVAEVEAMA